MGCRQSKEDSTTRLPRPFRRARVRGGPTWPAYYHDDKTRPAHDFSTAHISMRPRSVSRCGMALQRGGAQTTFTDLELESGQAKEEPPSTGSTLGILALASVNMVGYDPENSSKHNQDVCFGDAVFTVELVAFSDLRGFSDVITAVLLAGRTA